MPDILSEDLITRMAKFALGITGTLPTLELRLFVNNAALVDCTYLITDFVECTAPGYAAEALVAGDWSGALVSCAAEWDYPQITFTLTGPGVPGQTIYGHYLVDTTAVDWWWAGLWTTPFVIPAGGGEVKVTLNWDDLKCSS